MAPVLRKSQSHAKLGGPSESEKRKRKAPEDVSLASAKKQKSLKEARPKKGKKERGKTAPAEHTVPEGEREVELEPAAPEAALVLHKNADSDQVEEADPDIQAFVSAFDEESDGSDEPADDEAEPIRDVGKIPKPRLGRHIERQADDQADSGGGDGGGGGSGVIYVGRIPHGFYEHQMREYFGQFGAITRLRMSRNRKTGASKHYGFVEFADEETADIVARTMNNYLLFGRLLKCHVMPRSTIHERMWIGADRRFKRIPWGRVDARRLEQARPASEWDHRAERQRAKRAGRAEKLRALGYEYEAPELKKAVAQIEPASPACPAVIEGTGPSPVPAATPEAAVV